MSAPRHTVVVVSWNEMPSSRAGLDALAAHPAEVGPERDRRRRRIAGRDAERNLSRQTLALIQSHLILRLKHRGALRPPTAA